MSSLSNFLLRRDDGVDLAARPVRRDEVPAALRLILAAQANGDAAALAEFMQVAVWRGLDLTSIWVVADSRDRLHWAVLPMPLAGRAAMLMVPPRLRPSLESRHVSESLAGALIDSRRKGVTLAQVLLDPEHQAVRRAIVDSGFEDIAELLYLGREIRHPINGRILPDKYRLWRYDQSTHFRFGRCIERTYVDSLDCPRLNGRRQIEDIIDGHKAAGEFDPELWMLLSDLDSNDLGVLLLNRLQGRAGYELVYIGLTPEARGRGLADCLLRTALNALAAEGGGQLVAACDASNRPARKLYHRHGFAHLYARRALVKELTT